MKEKKKTRRTLRTITQKKINIIVLTPKFPFLGKEVSVLLGKKDRKLKQNKLKAKNKSVAEMVMRFRGILAKDIRNIMMMCPPQPAEKAKASISQKFKTSLFLSKAFKITKPRIKGINKVSVRVK